MLYYALLSLTLTLVSAKTFLPPSTPPLGWHVNKNNQYPTSTELIQFTLSLKETNQNKLEAIALEVSTPTHKKYGNFLTSNEIDALTEPEPDTLQNVLLWLKKYNVVPMEIIRKRTIKVQATVAQIEKLLKTTVEIWEHSSHSASPLLRATQYSLPSHLDNMIFAVFGLHGVPFPEKAATKTQADTKLQLKKS